jgi:anhydro-N-acetylmuramic acid kinase
MQERSFLFMNSMCALKVLGLASGSSLDGINAAILTTDGVDVFETGKSFDIPYDDNLREALRHMQKHFMAMNDDEKLRIEKSLTDFHIGAAREIIGDYDGIQLIAWSGHIICHKPNEHILYQIGDCQSMADELGLRVVGKFRQADILAGGQGAPLAAIYHAALTQHEPKPLVLVDIGGVCAVTFIGYNGELTAFDAGIGNAALNEWVNRHGGMQMDYNGRLGIMGKVHEDVLSSMLKHKFLKQTPPKATDIGQFQDKLEHLEGLSLEDGAATATAFVAEEIARAVYDFTPMFPVKVIVCGGGAKNPTLLRFLKQKLKDTEICTAEECGFDSLGLEAQSFAFLAMRRLNQMPTSYPSTTGAVQEVIGGEIFTPHIG